MKRMTFEVSSEIIAKLRKKAKSNGLTMSGYVRQLIIKDLRGE